jgi:glucokinase
MKDPALFLESFLAKGRMRPLLERMRVSLITDTHVGLYGARNVAFWLDEAR